MGAVTLWLLLYNAFLSTGLSQACNYLQTEVTVQETLFAGNSGSTMNRERYITMTVLLPRFSFINSFELLGSY